MGAEAGVVGAARFCEEGETYFEGMSFLRCDDAGEAALSERA
jgi:hypothetical protein